MFGDPYRYAQRPALLDRRRIDYAFVASPLELQRLFPPADWARIYRDPGVVLVVARRPENAALIARFELRHFHPMLSAEQFDALAAGPFLPRLLEEMAVYLAFRTDARIAGEFVRLANRYPAALATLPAGEFLTAAAERNPSLGHAGAASAYAAPVPPAPVPAPPAPRPVP
jgi:hypothetical protein